MLVLVDKAAAAAVVVVDIGRKSTEKIAVRLDPDSAWSGLLCCDVTGKPSKEAAANAALQSSFLYVTYN